MTIRISPLMKRVITQIVIILYIPTAVGLMVTLNEAYEGIGGFAEGFALGSCVTLFLGILAAIPSSVCMWLSYYD